MALAFISCQNPGTYTAITPVDFDSASVRQGVAVDPLQTPFEGIPINSLSWKDSQGLNTLVLSVRTNVIGDGDTRRTEFFARAYLQTDSLPVSQWELLEVLDSCHCDCAVELAEGPIPVRDVDQNGVAEVFLMYFLNDLCDASPMYTKLSVASGKNIYMLEGYTRRFHAPGAPGVNALKPGPSFASAPSAVQNAAYHYWDEFIRKEQAAFDAVKKEGAQNQD